MPARLTSIARPKMGKRSRAKLGVDIGQTLVRPGNRPATVVEFEGMVVSFFVDAAEVLGVPKSMAAIYAICFATAEPLSFSEIKSRLDVSSGSISQGLRFLRDIGALKKVQCENEKRERLYPELSLRELAARFLEQRLQKQLASSQQRFDAVMDFIPKLDPRDAKELRARLMALKAWREKSHALLPLVKAFLKSAG